MRTLLLAAFLALPGLAQAQVPCADATETRKNLAQKYNEQRVFYGVSAMGALIEVWVNPTTGSYTTIRIFPDGRACLMDAGAAGTTVALLPGVGS